jgi:hypothetical protein
VVPNDLHSSDDEQEEENADSKPRNTDQEFSGTDEEIAAPVVAKGARGRGRGRKPNYRKPNNESDMDI